MTALFFDTHDIYAWFTLFTLCVVLAMGIGAIVELVNDIRAGRRDPQEPCFTCPVWARSWHPADARHGWCGRCHAYTGRPAGLDDATDDGRAA